MPPVDVLNRCRNLLGYTCRSQEAWGLVQASRGDQSDSLYVRGQRWGGVGPAEQSKLLSAGHFELAPVLESLFTSRPRRSWATGAVECPPKMGLKNAWNGAVYWMLRAPVCSAPDLGNSENLPLVDAALSNDFLFFWPVQLA
jgi:hypothetical protein